MRQVLTTKLLLRTGLAMASVAGLWLVSAGVALAAGQGQADGSGESNLPFLFAVYTISWLAFFAYAFYMTRRQRDLRREIEELRNSQAAKRPG